LQYTGDIITWVTNLVIVRCPGAENATEAVSLGGTEWFVKARHQVVSQLTPFTIKDANTLTTTQHKAVSLGGTEWFVKARH